MTTAGAVLLISPRTTGIVGGVNRLQPGLGLGWMAAVLEQRGRSVTIYDTALGVNADAPSAPAPEVGEGVVVIGDPDDVIAARVAAARPAVVGISIPFSSAAAQALHLARLVRSVHPSVPVVLGGSHVGGVVADYAAAIADGIPALRQGLDSLADPAVDYVMVGECDVAFAELVEALGAGAAAEAVPGVVALHAGVPPRLPPSWPRADVKALPAPAWHLMDMEGYFRYGRFHSSKSTSNRVLNVMASRGCPEHCSFCSTPLLSGPRLRWREPAAVVHEITTCVERLGIEEVQFEDDSLSAHARHLGELCELMAGVGLPWCTPNGVRANYHASRRDDLFRKMKAAGCYQVTFACESGVQRVLDEVVHKRLRVDEIAPAIAAAKDAGLFVHTFWMLGFPGETRAEMERTVEVAASCGADSFSFAIVTPLPGTPLHRQVVRDELWWPGISARSANYRRSLIRVDGAASAPEFERWVEEANVRLNELATRQNPERSQRRSALVYDPALARSAVKQT